jgi:hypothetical protein
MSVGTGYRLRVVVLGLLAIAAGLAIGRDPDLLQRRVDQLAGPWEWSAMDWESRHLPPGLAGILRRAVSPPDLEAARATVRTYLRGELAEDGHDALTAALPVVVERELRQRGVVSVAGLAFPPVAIAATGPPRVLIVSPRHEIRMAHWVLLPGEMELETIEALERAVERLDLSALIARTGGLSTYPVIAPIDADPQFTLQTVAHEWTHTALFFTPLGRAYGGSPEARAINETAADVVGKEVADAIIADLGLTPRTPGEAPADNVMGDLRRIRLEVDARLAAGDVVGAEAFMEQERLALVARGYRIRRLNQAYFAFHGNYAEGPAASTEVLDSLNALRARSSSLGDFVGRVGGLTRLADLRDAVSR